MTNDKPTQIAKIVLVRPDRIGDVVITSSCFESLRKALPGVEIHLAAQVRMGPLFHRHPALKSFLALPESGDGNSRIEAMTEQFQKLQLECIVHLIPDADIECAAAKAEIPRRLGFRHDGGQWLTESRVGPKKRGEKHEGLYNFDLLELIGVPAPIKLTPWLTPEETALARLATKLPAGISAGNYSVLQVGSHAGKPRIGPEFFIAAARWLMEKRGLRVLLIGAEPDDDIIGKIIAGVGGASATVHDFCGKTDLAESAFLLRDAAVVFGRDSGPAHLAAAMGARTVTLMLEPERENSAQRWKPLGKYSWALEKPMERHWYESRERFARRNLAQYAPTEVVEALRQALEA